MKTNVKSLFSLIVS